MAAIWMQRSTTQVLHESADTCYHVHGPWGLQCEVSQLHRTNAVLFHFHGPQSSQTQRDGKQRGGHQGLGGIGELEHNRDGVSALQEEEA